MNKSTNIFNENQYFNFIDALRFITISISFLHHSRIIHFVYGHTFFFVLSGFILTYQANNEIEKKGSFSWFNFTMRRMLRIFPLYFLIIGVSYVVIPLLTSQKITFAPIQYYLTFTSNYYSPNHIFVLTILWAVAVQEQFYFFISFCYKFFNKYLLGIAFGMIVISLIYKLVAEYYSYNIYAHTLNHFSSFGIGIIAAKIFIRKSIIETTNRLHILLVALSVLFLIFASKINFTTWAIINNTIVSLIFAYIILILCALKNSKQNNIVLLVFEKFGKFSFGLYCFQGLVITFGNILFIQYFKISSAIMVSFLNFILLIIVAYISYTIFEKRFLNYKKYFR